MTYRIVRKYRDMNHPDHNKWIDTGLTLEEAQAHCNDPSTCEKGVWFDCYYEEEVGGSRPVSFSRQVSFMEKAFMLQTKNPAKYLGC